MSRSKRKPYYKDRGMYTHDYWSKIRHEWKQKTNENYYKDDFDLRHPRSIINDYDYCDYWWIIEVDPRNKRGLFWSNNLGWNEDDVKKWSRK